MRKKMALLSYTFVNICGTKKLFLAFFPIFVGVCCIPAKETWGACVQTLQSGRSRWFSAAKAKLITVLRHLFSINQPDPSVESGALINFVIQNIKKFIWLQNYSWATLEKLTSWFISAHCLTMSFNRNILSFPLKSWSHNKLRWRWNAEILKSFCIFQRLEY